MKESIEKDNGTDFIYKFKHSIIFDRVSYQYSTSRNDVLRNITIEFKAGDMTAVVGPSGGGKSTLIDLLTYCHVCVCLQKV